MTITITHKGTTVTVEERKLFTGSEAMKIISETIDKINQTKDEY